MDHKTRTLGLCCALIALLLLPTGTALANAPAPPMWVWFLFDPETAGTPKLQGVQLIGCETRPCNDPILLQQYGSCRSAGCFDPPPLAGEWPDSFECAAGRCFSRIYARSFEGFSFKLVAQFSDTTRQSEWSGNLPDSIGDEEAWRVTIRDRDLSLSLDPDFTPPEKVRQGLYLRGLALTLSAELVIATLYLVLRTRAGASRLLAGLLMILLINLATHPVVWFFFPSLGHFQPGHVRWGGVLVLGFALFYANMLVTIYRTEERSEKRKIILWTVVMLLVLSLVSVFLFVILAYASGGVRAFGLPSVAILVSSELFAVLAEAVLLFLMGKGSISKRHAVELSLLMNGASLLLGMLVLGF